MNDKLLRLVRSMELEEKILHIGVLLSLLALFFPWIGGQSYGIVLQFNGFGFYTGFIGHAVFALELFILAMTISPMLGGPVLIKKSHRNAVRLRLTALCTILLIAAFTVLLRSQVVGAEIRFGIYVAVIGSAIATLYAFLKYQEELKDKAQALFQHPDETTMKPKPTVTDTFPEDKPPPPPPPPPMPPEDHQLFSQV